MDYDLLQRHGVTNIECETESTEPVRWHSATDDVGGTENYNTRMFNSAFHTSPTNTITLRFELDAAELDRLERALRLLEEQDVIAADEEGFCEGPYGVSCWDAASDEDCDKDVHGVANCDDNDLTMLRPIGGNDNACMMQTIEPEEWDGKCFKDLEEDKAPSIMPAHHKYILKYR